METYQIKTAAFEGPFELLLELIERRKLFISDISLSEVTEDFLNYIKQASRSAPAYVSSFIVIAATLLLIKSRSLLPNFSLSPEEEKEVGTLEERLRLYKIFSGAGEMIKKIFGAAPSFLRPDALPEEPVFAPSQSLNIENLFSAAQSVLSQIPKKEAALPQIEIKKVISIEEMIDKLADRLQSSMKTSFSSFTGVKKPVNKEEKVLVIVGFLAMLELVRQGIADVMQENQFGDMEMIKVSAAKALV